MIREHVCEDCGKAFLSKGNLKSHTVGVHPTGDTIYKCESCHYESWCERNLKIHIKQKMAGKPLRCDMCGYETHVRGNLLRHKKSVHNEVKDAS